MATKFRARRAGIRELMLSGWMVGVLVRAAEPVAGRARASAPVSTGRYRDSITVRTGTRGAVSARAWVAADAGHAMAVEARTGNLARSL